MAETAARSRFEAGAFREGLQGLELPSDTVLDSEFVGPRGNHKPAIYIFDCLAWNGEWLTRMPYKDRWDICCTACVNLSNGIHLATTVSSGLLELFNRLKTKWIENGRGMDLCEGIVAKSLKGTLKLDLGQAKKSEHMLKLKFRDIRDRRY